MLVKGRRNARRVTASELRRRSRKVMADEEFEDVNDVEVVDDATVDVAPEASELLFEVQDVAELIAEVTEKPVEVTADEDTVVFSVDGTEFTVEADGAEEVLESRKVRGRSVKASRGLRGAKPARRVSASRRMPARKPVKAASVARRDTSRRSSERPAVTASRSVRRTARRVSR